MSDHLKLLPAPHRQRGMDRLESGRRRGTSTRRRGESIRELHHQRLLQALQRNISWSLNPLLFQSVQLLRPKQMTWKALTWKWTTSSWNQRWSLSKNILRIFSKLKTQFKVRARARMLVKIVSTTKPLTATLKLSKILIQKKIPRLKILMLSLVVKSTERKQQRDKDH